MITKKFKDKNINFKEFINKIKIKNIIKKFLYKKNIFGGVKLWIMKKLKKN